MKKNETLLAMAEAWLAGLPEKQQVMVQALINSGIEGGAIDEKMIVMDETIRRLREVVKKLKEENAKLKKENKSLKMKIREMTNDLLYTQEIEGIRYDKLLAIQKILDKSDVVAAKRMKELRKSKLAKLLMGNYDAKGNSF